MTHFRSVLWRRQRLSMSGSARRSAAHPHRTPGGFPLRCLGVLAFVWALTASFRVPAAEEPWKAMDYGPFLTASVRVPGATTNIAYKGITIPFRDPRDGKLQGATVFDTDLMRYAAGWTGGFLELKGVVFDGEHWAFPKIEGREAFLNPPLPGWIIENRTSEDPRVLPYGPLPRSWAHWKGLYLHGREVVLSYEVEDRAVFELPGASLREGLMIFSRTLNLGGSRTRQCIQIASVPPGAAVRQRIAIDKPDAAVSRQGMIFDLEVRDSRREATTAPVEGQDDEVLGIGVVGGARDVGLEVTEEGSVRLPLPATDSESRLTLLIWRGTKGQVAAFNRALEHHEPAADLRPLMQGGPPRWDEKLETQMRPGRNEGPYAIDELKAPEDNPWHSWLRFGGIAIYPDGTRAALCTWNGDVWIVSGLTASSRGTPPAAEALTQLTWQRIATGLFQPLGVVIVDGELFVLGRDQITRLHDLNRDGEADWYENFNNDALVSEHFHEFANDLKLGPDGSFYYLKCARHALPAVHPQHGTLIRVSRDGSRSEVVARGFRAVNGLGIGPRGELTTIDNQGHWMPANRLNWIKPGGWYGNQWAWNPEQRTSYDEPLCWIHNSIDRSGGTHLWVESDDWGPLKGGLISLSYGMGQMFLVLNEQVGERMQGAVTRFPLEFETGVMRGVFHPQDHQLYACGLFGWAGNKTQPGGVYRIRYTGRPLSIVNRLHIAKDGILLAFTDELDPGTALDVGSYDLKAWNYRWSAQYGSPDFRMNGEQGRDAWAVESVILSADRRSVFLRVPELRPVMQWHLDFNVRTAAGSTIQNFVHGTIHELGSERGAELMGDAATMARMPTSHTSPGEAPGLVQTLWPLPSTPETRVDRREVRLGALFVPKGTAPSPWVPPGRFGARWEGFLRSEIRDDVEFELFLNGSARLFLNETLVLDASQHSASQRSAKVTLKGGLNGLRLEYESPASTNEDAMCRLSWSSARFPAEPIPPTALVHDPSASDLEHANALRKGRELFGNLQCIACHRPGSPPRPEAMPELKREAPAFDGIGDRLRSTWMAEWILNPARYRANSRMPRVLHGHQAAADARDAAVFLGSLKERSGGAGRSEFSPELIARGEALFEDLGCVSCHAVDPKRMKGMPPSGEDVSLAHMGEKWNAGMLTEYLQNPAAHDPWTRMPDFHLARTEAESIAGYLLKDRRSHAETSLAGANIERGKRIVETAGCLGCHTLKGSHSTVAAASLEHLFNEGDWRRGCLGGDESARGDAPSFQLSIADRKALREFKETQPMESLGRDTPAEFARRQYRALQCGACHGRDGEPDRLSALLKAVQDSSARSSEEETDSGTVHRGRPDLSFAGEKLYASWTERFVAGLLPYKPRPDLSGRMPAFPKHARGIAEGFAQEHGYGFEAAPRKKAEAVAIEQGRTLTQVAGGFSCVSCHGVGLQPALAGKDTATVNFAVIADRLRESYYWRYILDPTRVMPGTMMPKFIGDDGRTALKAIHDGDARRQFGAIWDYLHSLDPGAVKP